MGCGPSSARVKMTEEEQKPYLDALQGSWSIKAISMNAAGQVNNAYVTPIGFSSATVTGTKYTMGGGPNGMSQMEKFSLTKDANTGQVYLDSWKSIVVTEGWPHDRAMANQVGEIVDFKTKFACIRWTRTEESGAVAGFGEKQVVHKGDAEIASHGTVVAAVVQAEAVATGPTAREEAVKALKDLKELLDVGAITEDEFNAKKQPLLAQM